MEIVLAQENAHYFIPQVSPEVARDRVEQKKASIVAGTVGALISRPKPDEIQLIGIENRLEPFWQIAVSSRTVYDRSKTYTLPMAGNEVKRVSVLGQTVEVDPKARGGPAIVLNGTEHCVQEFRAQRTFNGLTGDKAEYGKHLAFAKTEIADLANFKPEGVLVLTPQVRAAAVVRQLMAEVVKPVHGAQVIHEEVVNVEVIDLNFRPVYAFQYEWAAKNKKTVVEFDALTGEMTTNGKTWGNQLQSVLTKDLIFDLTGDAVGMFVPGGSIAVKLVRAVVDRKPE